MMAKHTVSIYDMCRSPEDISVDVWSEKITAHINYLILLRAIVQEEEREPESQLSLWERGADQAQRSDWES